MAIKINGVARSYQNLSGSMQTYICYASSPGAFSDPDANPVEAQWGLRRVNIQLTESLKDISQRNFEILLQSIGLRAMPTVMTDPEPVMFLEQAGAPTLTGEGFIWKFAIERANVFELYHSFDNVEPVGLLVRDLDGVILDSNVRLTTVDASPSGIPKNIEFARTTNL